MKINFSLSLKLTLVVVSVSAIIIFSLTYINIEEQAISLENVYSDKAVILSKALDTTIGNYSEFNDKEKIHSYILNFSSLNPEVLDISINLPDGEDLKVFASTDLISVNNKSGKYNIFSYENNAVVNIPIHKDNSHTITVITPINLSGEIVGTYEMFLSMNASYIAFNIRAKNLIMISVISLFILVFSFLFLLRRIIVKPIIAFRDATKIIGKGKLDTKIKIKSQDELGELSDAFNQMTDDLKKSRTKIEDYNKILEKLLNQKDEFIGQLGHDLKNPLQPLVGLLPVILEKEKDPKIKEHLRLIINNVEYIRNLIIKTLQLARLRSSNIKFDFENLNLNKEIEYILSSQKQYFKENNITASNNIKENIFIEADKLRFNELLNNLITNSVKYTPKSGGTISVNAQDDNEFIILSVKDTGIGMTDEQQGKIFDEFYKVDASSHEIHSSGLGLSICKRIVEKHGGKIWVESQGMGKGSTFYFTMKSTNKKINKHN